ncbi:hypothetical protein [Helicobacter acinonychis]|uniref:hypothetical protein n=1 Tax=Helicobacter acinonychis TaxID=212 RepID=UPI001F196697|nr:hypothetical protein [Helicobacter acinonychis]
MERLVSKILAKRLSSGFRIFVFGLRSLGFGCHDVSQSHHLLANTIASQMSIFADESICSHEFFIIAKKSLEKSFLFKNQYLLAKNKQGLIDAYIPKSQQFNFEKLISPLENIKSSQDFKNALLTYLKNGI